MRPACEIVNEFWLLFDQGRFADAGRLMHPDTAVTWPNTNEVFRGRDAFIRMNSEYPGRWRIAVERLAPLESGAVSVVRVTSAEGDQAFYAVSFFECRDGLISSVTEYWGDYGDPPAWRRESGLVGAPSELD